MTTHAKAHPPETLEGWFALHQVFRFRPQKLDAGRLERRIQAVASSLDAVRRSSETVPPTSAATTSSGWSCFARLIGSTADLMVIHFRDSLDAIGVAQHELARAQLSKMLEPTYAFLSVTEAGLYHVSADLARAAEARGGKVGDAEYVRDLAERTTAERDSVHVRRRLFPELPSAMPYVCFYPMSKRRATGQNWYTLSLDERSRLMLDHGTTGRRYAGRVQQIIAGAIGLDKWEWGVTLFARDPIEFKKLVTDMRFDEVSAKYAEFGDFYVGKVISGATAPDHRGRGRGRSKRARQNESKG